MSLKRYYNKRVKIKSSTNKEYLGLVEDYTFPEDNESENESIIIRDQDNRLVEFEESDIKEIEVI